MLLARCSAPRHASVRSVAGSLHGSAGGAGRLPETPLVCRLRQHGDRSRQRHIRCRRAASSARRHGHGQPTLAARLRGGIAPRGRRSDKGGWGDPRQREDSRGRSMNDTGPRRRSGDGGPVRCWWRLRRDTTWGGRSGRSGRHSGLTESLACKRFRRRGDRQPPHDWQMGQRVNDRNQRRHRGFARVHDGSDDARRDGRQGSPENGALHGSRQASPEHGSLRESGQAAPHDRSRIVTHRPSYDRPNGGLGSPHRGGRSRAKDIDRGHTHGRTDAGRESPARSIVRARLPCSQKQPGRAEEPGAEHEPHEARSPACPCQWMSPNSPAQGSHVPNPSS